MGLLLAVNDMILQHADKPIKQCTLIGSYGIMDLITRNPMLYNILSEPSIRDLIKMVTYGIGQGWIPLGGVATAMEQGRTYYTQAMTKTV